MRPEPAISPIFPRHLRWKATSPTDSTSSTSRISGSRWAATAKRQAHVHAGGVALDRRVEELRDLGELDDVVELAPDLGARHAEDGAVQVDVLAAAELGVEARADLEQAADAAVDLDPALGRLGDAREDLEQGALAGAVAADDADAPARPRRRSSRRAAPT